MDTEISQGLSCIFVTDKHGDCVTFRHLASEIDSVSDILDAMSKARHSFSEVSFSLQEDQEQSCLELPHINTLKELSHGQCWEIVQSWHVDRINRLWESTVQVFQEMFTSVILPCEMWRFYIDGDLCLDSTLRVRMLRRGRASSFETREHNLDWLSSPPSIARSRHVWLTQVLVNFYWSLPLERVNMKGSKVSKAATGDNCGLDYFVHLYIKKFDKKVPIEVGVDDLDPSQAEMVLTQQCLCDWWREKLQSSLSDWPGFRMDGEEIYALTV